jgi:Putative beta-lactamase-inhibitor-like, PepSY-like
MKKLLYCLLMGGFVMLTATAHAQFRSIPAVVTDSFKTQYPKATSVSWSDKVSAFQATFTLDNEKYVARYGSKGEWQNSVKKITKDALPAEVKDGLSKSKYADTDWEVRAVTVRYLPGSVQYIILVYKSGLQKKNLLFSSSGQLLKDDNTL